MAVTRYTNTEEGQQVLYYVSQVTSTEGHEVYKCVVCDDLFSSPVEDIVCGMCETEQKVSDYDPCEHEPIVYGCDTCGTVTDEDVSVCQNCGDEHLIELN